MQTVVKPTQNPWCPPESFAVVNRGVYRSAYPTQRSVPFLQSIGIKTLALLSIERLPRPVMEALVEPPTPASGAAALSRASQSDSPAAAAGASPSANADVRGKGITIVQIANLRSWQTSLHNGNDDFSEQDVQRALDIAVDSQWHPVLFASPSGELETSAVVGCIRHIQHWSLASILSESELFSVNPKAPSRRSVTSFLASWSSEQYPINEADVLYRNHLWFTQQRNQSSARHRRRRDFPSHRASPTETFEAASRPHAEDSASSDGSDSDPQSSEAPAQDIILSSIERARRSGTYSHRPRVRRGTAPQRPKSLTPTTPHEDLGGQSVVFAEWYLKALALVPRIACAEQEARPPHSRDAAPHVLADGVRNPPTLDPRSTFTKESIVEEDDD